MFGCIKPRHCIIYWRELMWLTRHMANNNNNRHKVGRLFVNSWVYLWRQVVFDRTPRPSFTSNHVKEAGEVISRWPVHFIWTLCGRNFSTSSCKRCMRRWAKKRPVRRILIGVFHRIIEHSSWQGFPTAIENLFQVSLRSYFLVNTGLISWLLFTMSQQGEWTWDLHALNLNLMWGGV